MRNMIAMLALGGLALAACGGSGSPPATGAGGSGGLGNGGAGGGGGEGIPPDCNMPACLAGLMSNCMPAGSCTAEMGAGFAYNLCFSNGVNMIIDLASGAVAKKDNAICWSTILAASGAMAVKDSTGVTLGTVTQDKDGNTVVTCTGGSPVILTSACDATGIGQVTSLGAASNCGQGACTP